MEWGNELWDQFELIGSHTLSGIDFVDKVAKFVKERIRIEAEYAKELRKLGKSFQPKKKEEEDQKFSFQLSFNGVVKETDDLAGQHELISENLNTNVYKILQQLHTDLKKERKEHLAEAKKVQDTLDQSLKALDAAKKSYERASADAEQAFSLFQKADGDMSMTKLQVEKFKLTSVEKGQAKEKALEEYKSQLDKTNNKQTLHYTTEMPAVFNQLQSMEENRIAKIGSLLTEYSDIHCSVMSIIQTCLNNMKSNAASVDGPKDSQKLIEEHRTALKPPGDIVFEEYGKSTPQTPHPKEKKKKLKIKSKSLFSKSKKSDTEDGNDFNTLSPGEQARICKNKIKSLDPQVQQLKSAREAMEKMTGVYLQNPSLGDPASMEEELKGNAKELDKYSQELFKYQSYLAIIEQTPAPAPPPCYSKPSNVQPPPAPSDQLPPPAPSILVPPVEEPEEDNEFDDGERCRVLYDFEGTNDGELPVHENEELIVTEADNDGSGWTKVTNGTDEGYVPTAYVMIIE
ncbi:cdc42-interacting protein 4 homolog [Actinia tenebrosa]|uniref:Cdc42-interacting protein 4 homolog n=1 Tax=Actinia tenebrosa TaxID=6105 RepID=A0A6P8IB18_ACTTE|nr:cdc42-interacting protein 4 homolog [Actinia tenebrosa]